MTAPQTQPSRFGWLVSNFAERVPGVALRIEAPDHHHTVQVFGQGCHEQGKGPVRVRLPAGERVLVVGVHTEAKHGTEDI